MLSYLSIYRITQAIDEVDKIFSQCALLSALISSNGGSYGIRTRGLFRDREACWAATPMIQMIKFCDISGRLASQTFFNHNAILPKDL